MAYMRSLTTRGGSLLARRYQPCISYALHDDSNRQQPSPNDENACQQRTTDLVKQSGLGHTVGFTTFLREKTSLPFAPPSMWTSIAGPGFGHHMSTTADSGFKETEFVGNVASEVLSDTIASDVVASQAPIVSEVSIAAAESFLPVAALQYFIDGVHSVTGFNWWASIALTTIFIRTATIPLLINQLKATTKLTLMRPQLDKLKEEMQNTDMDPKAVVEGQKRMQALFREYGVHPFTPLKGIFIQGPVFVSFYFAITNMVEKVPSFKSGGISWFTDLSTPDSLYILPALTGLSFLITVELNAQEGLEGNPIAHKMKNVMRGLALATVFFTHTFPKALFCYWISTNVFSLLYGRVISRAAVKKFLGIPELPEQPPPTSTSQLTFSWAALRKQAAAMVPDSQTAKIESPKPPGQKISSASILNQRIRTLEKQVKGRNRGSKSKR